VYSFSFFLHPSDVSSALALYSVNPSSERPFSPVLMWVYLQIVFVLSLFFFSLSLAFIFFPPWLFGLRGFFFIVVG